jgi:hypothetical protein
MRKPKTVNVSAKQTTTGRISNSKKNCPRRFYQRSNQMSWIKHPPQSSVKFTRRPKSSSISHYNRAKSNVWPNTICEVVYQNKQFSWTRTIKDPTTKESLAWQQAHQIAKEMYAHRWKSNDEYHMADFTSGAKHYYQPSMVKTPS